MMKCCFRLGFGSLHELVTRAYSSSTKFRLFRTAWQPVLRASPTRKQVRSALELETPNREVRSMIGGGKLVRTTGLRPSCGILMASGWH